MPVGKHEPKIAQMSIAGMCEQACVDSLHESAVHVEPSSHGVAAPELQWFIPSQ